MSRVVLDLVAEVAAAPAGTTVTVAVAPPDVPVVRAWCTYTGHELVSVTNSHAMIRRAGSSAVRAAASPTAIAGLPLPRLWIYTNFDCNLACDYCCARSSPKAPRQAIGAARLRRLATEAVGAGVRELYLTGGEPFLLPDLVEQVTSCVTHLPTTLLTNGMLLRGVRLQRLRQLPREGLTLQVSLDSATPDRHDRHRGAGTWQKAMDGIAVARREGFRVRVAATVAPEEDDPAQREALRALLDGMGVDRADQVIRPVARQGSADYGISVRAQAVLPEVTVTAGGVFWHPVGADHADHLVSTELFPLAAAFEEIRRRFARYRGELAEAALRFPCA